MISKNELIAQLRGRRRSVQAEIKLIQEELPLDDTRTATNAGYLMALEVEAAFLAGLLANADPAEQRGWLDDLLDDIRNERQS